MNKFQEFYTAVMNDEKAKKEFADIMNGRSFNDMSESDFQDLAPFAEKLGFEISAKEAFDHFNTGSETIDDDELDAVAGGKNDTYNHYEGDLYI